MDSMKTYNIVQYEAMQGIVNKQWLKFDSI